METINVIGCGRAAGTLLRLWSESGVFKIQDLLNSSVESAEDAAAFIGAGRAAADAADLRPADLLLIGAPDNAIAGLAAQAAESEALKSTGIAFHLSGALPSSVLMPLKERRQAQLASVHPVKSFADPFLAAKSFSGTYCAVEGDPAAADLLSHSFRAIGGEIISVNAAGKTAYHTAAVILSNYLVALAEFGLRSFERSGLDAETALKLGSSLMRGTVENIAALGTKKALTGPIARGDLPIVAKQLEHLAKHNADEAELYRRLGALCLELVEGLGFTDPSAEASLRSLLRVSR